MFPISASEAIVKKHYKRNAKFARAEDEMRSSLEHVIRGRQSIHPIGRQERAIEAPPTARKERSITEYSSSAISPVIRIKRLSQQQITKALNGDLSDWPEKLPTKEINSIKYNLRKRK